MQITDVKVTPSMGVANRNWSLLKIETDAGVFGLGEWVGPTPVEPVRQALIGRDPERINRLHQDLLWQMKGRGSGIEIALWDLKGKILNRPVHDLLGGKIRDSIRMYIDCHSGAYWTAEDYARRWAEVRESGELDPVYEPAAYAEQARRVVDEGFTAVKFDLDVANPWQMDRYDRSISPRQHAHIIACAQAVRDAIGPDVDLAFDLHGSFNLPDALRVAKDVEHLHLLWLEDPVRWEWGNVDAMAKIVAQTSTPICTGEILYGAQLHRDLIVKQACDLLEPDIPHSGGAIEIRRIAEMAQMYHMSIAPHNMTSPLVAVAAAHICSTIPNFLALEYHSGNIPLWMNMITTPDTRSGDRSLIEAGYMVVPDEPGLGIQLNEAAIIEALGDRAPDEGIWQ
ncbi:MAG: mandelate racemase/muconate lactonizing enzyme family protein [Gemmatimonadetes bacterium]|jgi:L-alanine-DL-glutamate epimerase-like enolase superfamily enzyme|nr:mandelate racemase/muconate lactonizing enzyme family protein [Gemmatimonadota bacterium]MBT7861246.1 mandelate racemase/muconate lactonizing enzyme family protein [Gemmatimonadota bacterium]